MIDWVSFEDQYPCGPNWILLWDKMLGNPQLYYFRGHDTIEGFDPDYSHWVYVEEPIFD